MTLDLGPLGRQSLSSAALLAVGALSLAYVAFTTLRVVLSTFILPGTSVCTSSDALRMRTDLT